MDVLALLAIALVLGALPTGVPSSGVVAYFVLGRGLAPWEAVAAATMGLTVGRLAVWAVARRGGRSLLSRRSTANIDELARWLEGRRRTRLGLFLAPTLPGAPSSAVFAGAGMLRLPIAPVALGYAVGRIVWFGAIAGGLAAADASLPDAGALASPIVLLPGIAGLALTLFLLVRIDWHRTLVERRPRLLGREPRPGELAVAEQPAPDVA